MTRFRCHVPSVRGKAPCNIDDARSITAIDLVVNQLGIPETQSNLTRFERTSQDVSNFFVAKPEVARNTNLLQQVLPTIVRVK